MRRNGEFTLTSGVKNSNKEQTNTIGINTLPSPIEAWRKATGNHFGFVTQK